MTPEGVAAEAEAIIASPSPAAAPWTVRFRTWRQGRPFWAGVWTVIGGSLVGFVPGTGFKFVFIPNGLIWLGILVGVLIAVCGLFLWIQPELRRLLGVVIMLLAFASFVTSDFGGLLFGMLLTLLGGSLALSWTPVRAKASV